MKLAKENLIYMMAALPGILGLMLQVYFAQGLGGKARYVVLALLLLVIITYVRHFSYMPKVLQTQGIGNPFHSFVSPEDGETIDLHWYEAKENGVALPMTIQIVSPIINSTGKSACVVGKEFYESLRNLDEEGNEEAYAGLEILAVREHLKRKHATAAFSFFALLFPLMLLLNSIVAFYTYDLQLFGRWTSTFRLTLVPTLTVILIFVISQVWVKVHLASEKKTDALLCRAYPISSVIKWLFKKENAERSGEKERTKTVQDQDFQTRVQAMKQLEVLK